MKIVQTIKKHYKNYYVRTIFTSTCSTIATLLFALYNLYIGIKHVDLFAYGIFIHNSILFLIRIILIIKELLTHKSIHNDNKKVKLKWYVNTSKIQLVLDFSMILPITLMVIAPKNFEYGLVAAIAIAAYTTFKVTLACINIVKVKKYDNLILLKLREINIVEALLSILTLQKTLIMANGSMSSDMLKLTSITSLILYVMILTFSIHTLVKSIRISKNNN